MLPVACVLVTSAFFGLVYLALRSFVSPVYILKARKALQRFAPAAILGEPPPQKTPRSPVDQSSSV